MLCYYVFMETPTVLYLNQADGRKEKKLENTIISNENELFDQVKDGLKKLLTIPENGNIFLVQNATTALIELLIPILSNTNEYEVLISAHEIKWFKTLFEKGRMPKEEVTYPNYAPLEEKDFIIYPFKIFDPNEFIKNPEKFIQKDKKQIVIMSHVSRMTGELLVTEILYKDIKNINSDAILIVDGSQAIGAIPVNIISISDAYIAVTSKFIDAEPHIGILTICPSLINNFKIKIQEIKPFTFTKELYSTKTALVTLEINQENTQIVKEYLNEKLTDNGFRIYNTYNQVPHIALVEINNPDKIVELLKQKGVIVSTNTQWSIVETNTPCLRISITSKTTAENIDQFIKILQEAIA